MNNVERKVRNPKFQVFQGADGNWYAHVRAANGRIVWQTEGYIGKESAEGACFWMIGVIQAGFYDIDIPEDEDEV